MSNRYSSKYRPFFQRSRSRNYRVLTVEEMYDNVDRRILSEKEMNENVDQPESVLVEEEKEEEQEGEEEVEGEEEEEEIKESDTNERNKSTYEYCYKIVYSFENLFVGPNTAEIIATMKKPFEYELSGQKDVHFIKFGRPYLPYPERVVEGIRIDKRRIGFHEDWFVSIAKIQLKSFSHTHWFKDPQNCHVNVHFNAHIRECVNTLTSKEIENQLHKTITEQRKEMDRRKKEKQEEIDKIKQEHKREQNKLEGKFRRSIYLLQLKIAESNSLKTHMDYLKKKFKHLKNFERLAEIMGELKTENIVTENNNNNPEELEKILGENKKKVEEFKLLQMKIAEKLEQQQSKSEKDILARIGFLKCKEENIMCSICVENEKKSVLVPCGHIFCEVCSNRIERCPICRSEIMIRQRIFG